MSIIVVAHNVREELKRCFGSIRDYAGLDVQLLLVDNGSRDGSVGWVRAEHPDVEVIELRQNVGVAAREHGLCRARGRYTMFLDSDAGLTPDALPRMVDALDRNPTWGLIGPKLIYSDGRHQPSIRRYPPVFLPLMRRPPFGRLFENGRTVSHHLMTDADPDQVRPVLYVLGACQLFRTDLARVAGPFSDKIFLGPDDAEWCIRIRDSGGEVIYFPKATVFHDYRRLSKRRPISRAALRHLVAYARFQAAYAPRRKELLRLCCALDAESGVPPWTNLEMGSER